MTSAATFEIADQRLATLPMRGRADELKEIGARVASVAEGRGGVLVLEGPPGIGKSRLLTEVLALAGKAGVRTLFGEAFDHHQSVPFFSLFMATLRADPPVGDADALRRLGSSADLSFWVVQHLQEAISAAAEIKPMAILLEDIHWADTGTLLALRSLAVAHPHAPVLWVLTTRPGAGGPAVQETLAVLKRANATFLRVPGLAPSAVADMVADAVRANVDESLLNFAAMAQGNPLLVRELVGGLAEDGRLAVSGGRATAAGQDLPRRLDACMQRRLDRLSPDAAEAVRVAAILPNQFSARLLAAMLDRQPASLMSPLEEAVRAGLLVDDGDQLRFGHRLVREVTRQILPQSLRRAMERQSASIMMAMGFPTVEIATQLARSADPGDKEAIDALRQAAQALSHSDANAAANLSKRALELTPIDYTEHGRVVAETVGLLNRARRYDESEELATAALSKASADEEAEIRLQLPAFTKFTSQRRVEENRRALEISDINEVTRARHLALLAYNLMLDDTDGQHRGAAEDAAAAAESVGDVEATVIANLTLASFDCADGNACRAVDQLEELRALRRPSDLPVAHRLAAIYYATSLALVDRLDEAALQVTAGMEQAQQEHNAMGLDSWGTIDGLVHLAAGRVNAARAAVESLPHPEQSGATELDILRIATLAQAAISTDDRHLLQQLVIYSHDAYSHGSSMVRRTAAYVLALAAWHRHDVDEALRWFGDDINIVDTPLMPHTLDQVILLAQMASATGDDGCRDRVLQALQTLTHDEASTPLFAAVARYVGGLLDDDADALVAAASMLGSTLRPLLYASASEDAGAQLICAGRNNEALDQFTAAFDTYTRLGAHAFARRVGRQLRRLGVERRVVSQPRAKTGWESLTESELKVVNLVTQGATNRAVADQLHLSTHTVKTHVHNAFGKMGIRSRAQLTELVH